MDAGSVKDLVFQLKKEIPNSVTIIISDAGEKPMITVGVSADLEKKISRWKYRKRTRQKKYKVAVVETQVLQLLVEKIWQELKML